jgi:hypothetical protein
MAEGNAGIELIGCGISPTGPTFEDANLPLVPTFALATLMPPFIRPKLDWIAVRELRPLPGSARVVRATRSWSRRISDHDFIVCDLEL